MSCAIQHFKKSIARFLIGNTQLLANPTHYTNNWDENFLK